MSEKMAHILKMIHKEVKRLEKLLEETQDELAETQEILANHLKEGR